jgi:tetratricopeptide (TPR) repeat protein
MSQGRYEMASEEFRRVIDVVPQSPDGYFLLGRALLALGNTAEAKEQFAKAIKIDGTVPIFHLEMGTLLARLGETTEAREHLQRAVALNPAGPEAAEARRRLQGLK